MTGRRTARTAEIASRELATALVRAEGTLPDELEGKVIDALGVLLELADSLRDLPLDGVSPVSERLE